MTLPVLRDDALRTTDAGFTVLVNLPWIRSLPIESLHEVVVEIDGAAVPVDVVATAPWWHVQDRVAITGDRMLPPGPHDVSVSFRLAIPYLPAGPDGPLVLPFGARRTLVADAPGPAPAAEATERVAPGATTTSSEPGWTLAASAFNWTPEVIGGDVAADVIAADVVRQGVADTIEIEAGQVWRSFPTPDDAEVDALRDRLDEAGGRVSILGASIDDWAPGGARRTDDERLDFLVPQLRAAARLGALGVRVPLGQAGPDLLRRLQPVLHDLGITLFEEAQGHQTSDAAASAFDDIAALDDPRIRLLIDISMLMPALPVTYLERLRAGGLPEQFVRLLETEWRDPATQVAVMELLRSGGVPGPVHTLFMDMVVRFGRSDAADLRAVLPLVRGIHLKFWDLDDTDGRISRPIREIGTELRTAGFAGTLCSEWGGHEWLDDDPTAMTRAHLELAAEALAR